MSDRPTVLMISPAVPALTGNGLQMRAAMTLRALARHYQVTLLVDQRYASASNNDLHPDLAALCSDIYLRRGGRVARRNSGEAADAGQTTDPPGPFDVVHLFRLASVETGRQWFASAGAVHLDLDDVESSSRLAMAQVMRQRGQTAAAVHEERLAARSMQQEIDALLAFDRVYVCSPGDEELLPICGRAEIRILPNVVDIPQELTRQPDHDPFTLLFVGTLTYFPNEDGLMYFTDEVLPLLRANARGRFRLQIVGHAPGHIRQLGKHPDIDVLGFVASLESLYAGAGAVIVPLRAGGGTRIKVLEAAARRVPIVTTTIGVEGIAMQHDEHCLIADAPESLAEACIRLMEEAVLRDRLTEAAYSLVESAYSPDVMALAIAP